MRDSWLRFVPLFVAVDAVGVLPLFMGLTEGIDAHKLLSMIYRSVAITLAVALAFLAVETAALRLPGITVADFMIAGVVLLFAISMGDLLSGEKAQRRVDPDSLAAVPLGVPLITGPAVLTTCILLINQYSLGPVASAIVVNILITRAVFRFPGTINGFLGKARARTLSKIASLLLAAIAVMMVRKGIVFFLQSGADSNPSIA